MLLCAVLLCISPLCISLRFSCVLLIPTAAHRGVPGQLSGNMSDGLFFFVAAVCVCMHSNVLYYISTRRWISVLLTLNGNGPGLCLCLCMARVQECLAVDLHFSAVCFLAPASPRAVSLPWLRLELKLVLADVCLPVCYRLARRESRPRFINNQIAVCLSVVCAACSALLSSAKLGSSRSNFAS